MSMQHLENTHIDLQWLIPERVFSIVIRGSLSEADARHADEMLIYHLNNASNTVHLLLDAARARKASSALLNLRQPVLKHAHIGWIVTVGIQDNPILNFGITALSLKTKIRHRDWPTVPEALAFLQQVDPTLPDMSQHQHKLTR